MSDKFLIRKLRFGDCEALYGLMVEQLKFHGVDEIAVKVSAEDLRRDCFQDKAFDCFVVEGKDIGEDNGKLVGMALYFMNYEGFIGKTAFLDHMFVKEKYTGQGLGTALWEAVSKDVSQRGALKLSLIVLNYNDRAKTFYKNKGAEDLTDTRDYHTYEVDIGNIKQNIE